MLVAELDGVMVGTVVAGWDGWRGHIHRLAVAPDHRQIDVARALLTAAHERFVVLGAVLADAMVEDGNLDAYATYEEAGYRKQEGRTRWLPGPPHPR